MTSEPRGLRFQDAEFDVTDLTGRVLEHLAGYCAAGDDLHPEVLLVKPSDMHWQRCFLDAGLAFWEEWTESDAIHDYQSFDVRRVDYGRLFGVLGVTIVAASCEADRSSGQPRASCLRLSLSCGEILLRPEELADIHGAAVVSYRPR